MKRKKNIGLLRVLLSERKSLIEGKESLVLDYEFFHKYFNGDCEKYLRYVMDNNITEDERELNDLVDSIGCEHVYMKIRYEKNPEDTIKEIKEYFSSDIVDDGRLILDKDDLAKLLSTSYLSGILDDFGLFEDWYPEIDNDEIEDTLNDDEKNKLSKMMGKESFDFDDLEDTDLLEELKNIYLWAYRQASEDEVFEKVTSDIKYYFQTDDIKFDEDSKGNRLLSIKIDKFINQIVRDYFNSNAVEGFDIFEECGNFVCFLEEMSDYDSDYGKIKTIDLDYFYPDSSKVAELFHEYFKQEIG